jgi:hypothetical protein
MTLLIARAHDYAASSHGRCLLASALTNEWFKTHEARILAGQLGRTGENHGTEANTRGDRLPHDTVLSVRHKASTKARP